MYYFLITFLVLLAALIFRSIHVAPPPSRARSAERFFPPHLKHLAKPARAAAPPPISYKKHVLLGIVVMLLGYTVFSMVRDHQARLGAESAQRAQEAVWAREATEIVRQLHEDTDLVERLVRDCIRAVERGSNSIFGLATDRRDIDRVRRLLVGLNPYDIERKLEYVTMEQMRHGAFMIYLAERAYARHQRSRDAVIEFAVTYQAEGFAGMREAWGILECPLRDGTPTEPRLTSLYME